MNEWMLYKYMYTFSGGYYVNQKTHRQKTKQIYAHTSNRWWWLGGGGYIWSENTWLVVNYFIITYMYMVWLAHVAKWAKTTGQKLSYIDRLWK